MRLHIKFFAACAAAFIVSTDAATANGRDDDGYWSISQHMGPYVSGFLGGAFGGEVAFGDDFTIDLDSGFLIGGTVGFDNMFANPAGDFRIEAELSYRRQGLNGGPGHASLTALMANAWFDFDTPGGGPLVPYAGIGLGGGFTGSDVGDDTGLAFQIGGGLNYHLDYRLVFGFNYRFLTMDLGSDINYSGHQFSVSMGYKF